jgi:hypothetical protein
MTAGNIQWYENTLDPTVKIWVKPLNPNIIIPAQGGEFSFNVWIWNTTSDMLSADFWTSVVSGWGFANRNPVILIPAIVLVPDTLVNWQLTQRVPEYLPRGEYSYKVKVGAFPHDAVAFSEFSFAKARSDGGNDPAVADWSNTGDEPQPAFIPSGLTLTTSPNPFNPSTVASYTLPFASHVSLKIYDTAGRLVATLVEGWHDVGEHRVTFNGSKLASGVYLARLEAMSGSGTTPTTSTQKLVLLK